MDNLLSKAIAFVVAFVVVGGLMFWWRSREETPVPAPAPERLSLLDFEDDYRESVEVAHWIFENHQCKNCHTLSETGMLGLTELGQARAQDFQGCPGMLTTVMTTVGVPHADWTPQQRKTRQEFDEFGCTACHQVGEESIELTEVGAKAAVMHMSCSGVMGRLSAQDSKR